MDSKCIYIQVLIPGTGWHNLQEATSFEDAIRDCGIILSTNTKRRKSLRITTSRQVTIEAVQVLGEIIMEVG